METTHKNRMRPATWAELAAAIVSTGIADKLFDGDPEKTDAGDGQHEKQRGEGHP